MKVAILFLCFVLIKAQPKPKPVVIEKPTATQHSELYQRQHSSFGPFIDSLPKKKSDRLRRILEQEDLSKHEIDNAIDKWISNQDPETRDKYDSFKRALKVRTLRLKLRHELKIKSLSDEAKKLDEAIQNVIDDKELTWTETLHEKNELVRKASPKVLKELGINPGSVKENDENDEEADDEGSHDYENQPGKHGSDYTTNNNEDFDYNGNEHDMRKTSRTKANPRIKTKPIGRPRPNHPNQPDYNENFNNGNDYDENHH